MDFCEKCEALKNEERQLDYYRKKILFVEIDDNSQQLIQCSLGDRDGL